jgi:carboxypeptidase C (cathepsin A)
MKTTKILSSLALTSFATAFFPPPPENIVTKIFEHVPGASISYKETHICETKAKAYAGYVNLPADYISDTQGDEPHNISIFFWYFEARNSPRKAPTTIYLAGGPGESSVYGATSDGGPCYVLDDSNSTESNPWSWNENVNMLYVDQPVTAGFSYAKAVDSTWNLLWDGSDGSYTPATPFEAYNGSVPGENATLLYGTFPEQNLAYSANTSVIAARTLWHFAQLWFTEFPQYHRFDDRINLAGHSYGGFWVSTSMAYFERQNERIEKGEISGKCLNLDLAVITNGQVDFLHQAEWYPQMAYNNTYGFEAISEDAYKESLNNFVKPGGCRDLIEQCRASGELLDPEEVGINQDVNNICSAATYYCALNVLGAYSATGRSPFDMSVHSPSPNPPSYTTGFANRAWV